MNKDNTYRILLDPALGVSAEALAEAWADTPECAQAGKARLPSDERIKSFSMDPVTLGLVIGGVALTRELVMALVKRAMERAKEKEEKKAAEEVSVKWVPDPQTGLPILHVTRPEE